MSLALTNYILQENHYNKYILDISLIKKSKTYKVLFRFRTYINLLDVHLIRDVFKIDLP